MPTPFNTAIGGGLSFRLARPYAAGGSTEFILSSGSGAVIAAQLVKQGSPPLSADAPTLALLIPAANYTATGILQSLTNAVEYQVTGLTGDTLTPVAAAYSGTDHGFAAGDVVSFAPLAKSLNDLATQVVANNGSIATRLPLAGGTLTGAVVTTSPLHALRVTPPSVDPNYPVTFNHTVGSFSNDGLGAPTGSYDHVCELGWNANQANGAVPSYPVQRDVFESRFWNGSGWQFERHVGAVRNPDGTEVRPITMTVQWSDITDVGMAFRSNYWNVLDGRNREWIATTTSNAATNPTASFALLHPNDGTNILTASCANATHNALTFGTSGTVATSTATFYGSTFITGAATIHVADPAQTTLTVVGADSQTAPIFLVLLNSGQTVFSVDSAGNLLAQNDLRMDVVGKFVTFAGTGGGGGGIQWVNSPNAWRLYQINSDGHLYLYDLTNSKFHAQFTGGASGNSTVAFTNQIVARTEGGQTADAFQVQQSDGTPLSGFRALGSLKPAHLADSAAANDSLYFSTTASKLVYKDAGGTVNNLY